MGETELIVFIKDDDISSVKFNNDMFFRHENEEITHFYNNRIIPLLAAKGINFVDYYKKEFVKTMNESDYKLSEEDRINITKEQMKKIVSSSCIEELEYDEKIYTVRLYEKIYGKPYNLDINEQWETAKDLVNRVLNYKSVNISKKDIMQPFSFDNLSNPLFTNDIVGVVIDKIRDDKFNNDIYDILTGRIRSGSRYKSLDVSTEDLLEYENMNFMIRKKNSHNKKAILLPNKPFKNMHDLKFDKEKYYSKLYGPSYYSYYYQEVDGDPWRYLPSDSKAETTHRIYINIPVKNIVRLAIVFYEKLNQNNVSYKAKFAIYDRDDKMVIYTDEDNCIKAMNVIQNLYSDMPELFDEKYKSPMTTAPTLVPGVGVANEPNSLHTSHNIRMEDVLNWALSITTLKYMINNDDKRAKESFVDSLVRYISIRSDKDIIRKTVTNNIDKIEILLLDYLETHKPIFDTKDLLYRNRVVLSDIYEGTSEDRVPIYEWQLYKSIKDAIGMCKEPLKIKDLTNNEIIENADIYGINPDNVAFNYDNNKKTLSY